MARHKPAAEGGYQRGEETRARIVEAAVEVFGERGYDRASTRDIATAAGVNAPAIQYYFDGKEGVYLECVEHLITLLWRKMSPCVEAAEAALADAKASDKTLIDVSLGILGTVVSTIQDSPRPRSGAHLWIVIRPACARKAQPPPLKTASRHALVGSYAN